ncbi:MAG: hypothetical protein IKM61_07870 [Eubacteriaceae bacterium]|nr:hypothetical protein [Eubacteriaceae bacterium]
MSAINSYIHKIAHLIPVFVFVIILFRVFRLTYLRKKGYRSPLRREILMGIYLMFILAIFSQTVFSDLDSFMQEGWKT